MKKQLIASLMTIGLAASSQLCASTRISKASSRPSADFYPPTPNPGNGDAPWFAAYPPTPNPGNGNAPWFAAYPPTPNPGNGNAPWFASCPLTLHPGDANAPLVG